MKSPSISRLALQAAVGVLVVASVAAAIASSARAAFPGVRGPIIYSRHSGSQIQKRGLYSHGPRSSDSRKALTDDRISGFESHETLELKDDQPSFSADGRLVAFSGNREQAIEEPPNTPRLNYRHIYVMAPDGSGVRALTSGPFEDFHPSFSPDGKQVVFMREPARTFDPHIFVVNTDGTELRQLTSGKALDSEPVYTPNGARIVFTREANFRADSDIFSMAADGSDQRVLIGGPNEDDEPDVSPDGRRILFARYGFTRLVGERFEGENVFVASSNGRHVHPLTGCPVEGCGVGLGQEGFHSPAWAPDGKHIVLLNSFRRESPNKLEVMRATGRPLESFRFHRKVFDVGQLSSPTWGSRARPVTAS